MKKLFWLWSAVLKIDFPPTHSPFLPSVHPGLYVCVIAAKKSMHVLLESTAHNILKYNFYILIDPTFHKPVHVFFKRMWPVLSQELGLFTLHRHISAAYCDALICRLWRVHWRPLLTSRHLCCRRNMLNRVLKFSESHYQVFLDKSTHWSSWIAVGQVNTTVTRTEMRRHGWCRTIPGRRNRWHGRTRRCYSHSNT